MSPDSHYTEGQDHRQSRDDGSRQDRQQSGPNPNPSYRNAPQVPTIVTIQHQDGRQPQYPEQDLAGRPSGDYNNPFGQSYDIPYSPQRFEMPAPRPFQPSKKSFSEGQSLGYQGGTGLVRKFSTRVQQAIEAVKVPYQPVYPATLDEEGGYQHGRDVDLHGELRDEWEMAPVSPETRPLNYPHRDRDDKEVEDVEDKPAEVKTELTDDEKYLVSYTIEDTRHPYNWPKSKKYGILGVLCLAAICVTATSSIQASTYNSIEREFRLSRPEAVLGVSLYVLGLGLGSRERSTPSKAGRHSLTSSLPGPDERVLRTMLHLPHLVFPLHHLQHSYCDGSKWRCFPLFPTSHRTLWIWFPQYRRRKVRSHIALTRLLHEWELTNSVADMFRPGTVDIPMALYTLAPLVGPCLGPLLGGFINQNTTFRVTFYTVIGWSGVTFVLLYFFVPETFLPKILQREATKKRLATGDGKWYAPLDRTSRTVSDVFPSAMWQPIQMMVKEPMALILNCWTALVLGVIYLFFNAIPFTFRTVYGL